jgi:glycosyltransferase involved in cell wall biosynthesis
MLDRVTPVLLTYNESENIARTLSRLMWATDIVVVDSGSTDETLTLLADCPKVRVFQRQFDTHARQWRYAVENTGITTEWILRLDADYQLTDALIAEIDRLAPDPMTNAYRIGFIYAVFSQHLRASLYPHNTILLRRGHFSVRDRGHTERWEVSGGIATLTECVIHDDRKSVNRWLEGQARYMQLELGSTTVRKTGLIRWLRLRPPLMPIATFLYCLFGKGLILNGRAGIFYALQRMVAEAILSLLFLERKFRTETETRTPLTKDQR